MMKRRSILLFLCVALVAAFVAAGPASASEGGLGWYPDGIDDFMLGALPPPGYYFLNYALYLNISGYKDIRAPKEMGPFYGDKLRDLGGGRPDVKGWSVIEAPRLVTVTKQKILGGNFAWHVIVPIQHLEFTKAEWNGADLLDTNDHHTATGLMNVINGYAIAWHFNKNLHAFAGFDVNIPVGSYDRNHMANTGKPYWSFTPIFSVSYITDGGFQVGAKMMYDFNTTNRRTDYYSGQQFHADYIVGQQFGLFTVGISGYYVNQVEDDEFKGDAGFNGNRAAAFAAGPAVAYQCKNISYKVKAQFDTYVKNRPQTERYWFNLVYAF
jgi:hypothetical protein